MKVIGVIPARYASTRFAGKVLAMIQGRPMIEYVWRRAMKSKVLNGVWIACDHDLVRQAAQNFGAQVVMTDVNHESGTDRIAQAVKDIDCDVVINIQGDEPLIDPNLIDQLAQEMINEPSLPMATAMRRIERPEDLQNPSVVKVVVGQNRNALYFSRSPIPYHRDNKSWDRTIYYKHLGIYAYRKHFLMKFAGLPDSFLEKTEKLEQLRVIESGFPIRVIETQYESIGVDTPEDLKRVSQMIGD